MSKRKKQRKEWNEAFYPQSPNNTHERVCYFHYMDSLFLGIITSTN